jgi:hydrogenase/urease accessory protein HupE
VSAGIDRWRMIREYTQHGIMHILTGYDHLLFMAALVLAVSSVLDLVKVVTAFTVAHTVTLTLSVLNVVRLPSHIVEPVIAASIVFVAAQNFFFPSQTRGWSRLLVAFGFGLFHGLGFAGGLLDTMEGLPGLAIATAIVAFSIGVEIGHQAVALPLFLGMKALRNKPATTTPLAVGRYASVAVCFAGMYYLVAALR